MDAVRYIHAADLHLDTPFQGLSREAAREGHLTRLLQNAAGTALERLIRLCEAERPHFLILAGDIYNQEQRSIKAQLQLRDGCVRLQRLGIPVFIAHGNHDPLSSRLTSVEWPDNVTIFGETVERRPVMRDERVVALVHGISHARQQESRNLAKNFSRDTAHDDAFQIGVLHCAVEGQRNHDRYAPCALSDLLDSRLDAWALGHIHERGILQRTPFIAYSGNTQGLHINEQGPRGCLSVTATNDGSGWICREKFVPLSSVQWQQRLLELNDVAHIDEVEQRLLTTLDDASRETGPECEALIVRVRCTGRTPLDMLLREPATQAELTERTLHLSSASPKIWLKDLVVETRPPAERAEYLQREDLLGETMRLMEAMRTDPALLRSLAGPALDPLFRHPRFRGALDAPDDEETRRLLDEAERLCADLLEAR